MKSLYTCKIRAVYIIVMMLGLLHFSCKKEFLDAKPNLALVVPSSIEDYQAILDNNTASTLFNFGQPGLNEVGAGDLHLQYTTWQILSTTQERNAYIWAADIFAGQTSFDWNNSYKRILNANIVLDGLENIKPNLSNQGSWNNIKGTALFYRSYDFFCLLQEFAKAYEPGSATTDPGIPLRTTSNINVKSDRATVQATYDQIISDLKIAKPLLPPSPLYPTRPGKGAVYALLSRVYLSQRNYSKASAYADSSLQISDKLIDFNTLSKTSVTPIVKFSKEVIYHQALENYSAFVTTPYLLVDSNLYKSYDANDLRKQIYFRTVSGLVTRKASYCGNSYVFGGLATDEMYLIRAECSARGNDISSAMEDLNALLSNRWVTGTFVLRTAINSTDALNQILAERRKELVFRGLRWGDLKRLNKDPATAVTLTRVFNGQIYTLPPNSNLYVFPIPPDEVVLNGLQQNPR